MTIGQGMAMVGIFALVTGVVVEASMAIYANWGTIFDKFMGLDPIGKGVIVCALLIAGGFFIDAARGNV